MSLIAFDLDNTILNYETSLDELRHQRNELKDINAKTKADFKAQVIREFGEDYWTELQGFLYTQYVAYSSIEPAFLDLLNFLNSHQWRTSIISHKTEFPFMGPRLNMRECALAKLEAIGVVSRLSDGVHFFGTKKEKIDYINNLKPDIYIDDLVEILDQLSSEISRLLFTPNSHAENSPYYVISDWHSVYEYLEFEKKRES